ncbi:MAG: dopey family protein [archaeon]|nr:dopey family protein [archaeon]
MKNFESKLNSKIISQFNSAKEWSDLTSALKDLKSLFAKYENDVDMAQLTDKVTLSKRLAQCLNPNLPGGLHEVALEIYIYILNNIISKHEKLGEDLGLYSYGLFPFFQNASVNIKTIYLDQIILNKYILLPREELELCLPGLLVSILPGLEEQNETNTKLIKEIFNKIRLRLLDDVFYGNLWSIIIRNQRLRGAASKYILETVPTYKSYMEKEAPERKEIIERYYPKINTLVVNALCCLIEDSDVQTVRSGMDFIIQRFPLVKANDLITDEKKVKMIISALHLLIKNEYSTTRRLCQWLLGNSGTEEDLDLESEDTQYMFNLLIFAFKHILKEANYEKKIILDKIKIIEQLLSQQVTFSDVILENVSVDLITYICKYWELNLNSEENSENDEVIMRCKLFFSRDICFLELLWISLAKKLESIIEKENFDPNAETTKLDVYIKILRFCLLYIDINMVDAQIKYYIPIISNLLNIMNRFNITDSTSFTKMYSIAKITLIFIRSLQNAKAANDLMKNEAMQNLVKDATVTVLSKATSKDIENEEENKENEKYIRNLFKNKIKISEESSLESIQKDERYMKRLESLTGKILDFQNIFIKICEQILPLTENSIATKKEIKLFKYATEIILRMQEYALQTEVPDYLYYLEKIAIEGHPSYCLKATDFLINLLTPGKGNEIYLKIRESLITKPFGSFKNDKILQSYLRNSPENSTCAELIMANLWGLLETNTDQKKVTDLLIKFSDANLDIFINTISKTFSENSVNANVNAIQKCTQFWRLSNEYYPELTFFKQGHCIFNMLDFLDHDHPLLRHLSKLWLNQSVTNFNKVVDPLLRVLLSNDIEGKVVDGNQIIFTKEYDNTRITNAFRKLKNIIINTTDLAIKYFLNNTPDEKLIEGDNLGKELDKIEGMIPRGRYIQLLINISLRFINGKISQEISESFQNENQSVNAASCEFLEFLLSFIEPKTELMNITKFITFPVVDILKNALEKENEFIQVPLLNLLKVLLLSTKEVHKNFKEIAADIFSNIKLLNCLTMGIEKSSFFVRGHFLSFIESCLPILTDVLEGRILSEYSKSLIIKTSAALYERTKYTLPKIKPASFSVFDESTNKFIIKNYLEDYNEYKQFDGNDFSLILKGLREIIFHFMKLNSLKISDNFDWIELKKNIFNAYKSSLSFGDYFFSIFSSSNEEEVDERRKTENPIDIFMAIIDSLLICLSSSWKVKSYEYLNKDFCLSSLGILAYIDNSIQAPKKEENLSKYPIIKVMTTDELLRLRIIDIVRSIFLKYPIEFFSHFFILWNNKKKNIMEIKDKLYKVAMLEMLVEMKVPMNLILATMNKILKASDKYKYKKGKNKNNLSNYNQAVYECQILHFVYSYLIFEQKNKEFASKNVDILLDIWNEVYNLLYYIYENTKIAYTYCWIYEIITVLIKVYPGNEELHNSSVKANMSDLFYNVHKKLVDISFNKKFDSIFEDPDFIITPIIPSIYTSTCKEIYPSSDISQINSEENQKNEHKTESNKGNLGGLLRTSTLGETSVVYKTSGNSQKNSFEVKRGISNDIEINYIHNFFEFYYESIIERTKKLAGDALMELYRKVAFLTLKNNFNSIIDTLFRNSPKEKGKYIGPLIENLINVLKNNHIHPDVDKFFNEASAEFLSEVIDCNNKIAFSTSKQNIYEYFFNENFFATTPTNLGQWKKILENVAKCEKDIIGDLINQMNSGFLFLKGSDSFKIKTLRRISFVIYSCPKDTFSHKLPLIKEKVKDLLMAYGETPILEGEIFLMIRVLFLRFSHDNVMEMIRTLWPIIFSELVTILEKKKKTSTIKLALESLKFIELLSLANIEEFSLYQWIFICDTYDLKKLDEKDPKSLLYNLLKNEMQMFKPVAMNVTDQWELPKERIDEEPKEKNNLIITEPCKTNEELAAQVKEFFYSIGDMNNFAIDVDYAQIEKCIEEDFLGKSEEK